MPSEPRGRAGRNRPAQAVRGLPEMRCLFEARPNVMSQRPRSASRLGATQAKRPPSGGRRFPPTSPSRAGSAMTAPRPSANSVRSSLRTGDTQGQDPRGPEPGATNYSVAPVSATVM